MRETYPFTHLGQVVAYVHFSNPARFRRFEISDSVHGEPHPLRIWGIISAKLFAEIKKYKNYTERCRRSGEAFERYYLQTPPDALEDIASDFGCSPRTIKRQLREAWDYLDSRMKALEVIPK